VTGMMAEVGITRRTACQTSSSMDLWRRGSENWGARC